MNIDDGDIELGSLTRAEIRGDWVRLRNRLGNTSHFLRDDVHELAAFLHYLKYKAAQHRQDEADTHDHE